jgi:hypothetical protein
MAEVQEQQLGRAMNAVQEFLVHKLLFPKVYLDADWNGSKLDVLAIDRGGVGDVYAVHIVPVEPDREPDCDWQFMVTKATILVNEEIELLGTLPAQFRYVALTGFSSGLERFYPSAELIRRLLAKDGVGRIGILQVDLTEDDPTVRVILKAERFRSSKEMVELADRFVAEHTANWEFREEL